MAIGYGSACPKPQSGLVDKIAKRKAREALAADFRRQVWARDQGLCRYCRRVVVRTLERVANRGEVHHLRGRNVAPEDRYTVSQAVLLCSICHEQAQRHAITIPRK